MTSRTSIPADSVIPDPHAAFQAFADTRGRIAHARGVLDLFSVELLRGAIDLLLVLGCAPITLDCDGLECVDTAGAKYLTALEQDLLSRDIPLRIVNAAPEILSALRTPRIRSARLDGRGPAGAATSTIGAASPSQGRREGGSR
jgi:anti-anti-sigma regulatory factor